MLRIYLCFLCLVFLISNTVGAFALDEETSLKAERSRYNGDKIGFSIMYATEDIATNMDFLLKVRKETDAGSATGWMVSVADKLPSQPVAVIQVIIRSGVILEQMCPRIFFEDATDWVMIDWMKRSETSLKAFTLSDSQEEAVRQKCLARIQKSLEESKTWK